MKTTTTTTTSAPAALTNTTTYTRAAGHGWTAHQTTDGAKTLCGRAAGRTTKPDVLHTSFYIFDCERCQKLATPQRYIVRDLYSVQARGIGRTVRDHWQIIDTTSNSIEDTFASKRAATMAARDLNVRAADTSAAPAAAVTTSAAASVITPKPLTGNAYDDAQTEALRVRDSFIASIAEHVATCQSDGGALDLVDDALTAIRTLVARAVVVNSDLQLDQLDGYSDEVITCGRCARKYLRRHVRCVCRG